MAIIAGLFIALIAVLLVLEPLLRAATGQAVAAPEPLFSDSDDEDNPVLARRDRALAALKEIDFDRATGKLSDEDYERMKAQFSAEAIEALRAADADAAALGDSPSPHTPAPRLTGTAPRFCIECGTPTEAGRRFCMDCGAPVGAPV